MGTQVIGSSVSNPNFADFLDLEPWPAKEARVKTAQRFGPLSGLVCSLADWDPNLVTIDGWKIIDGAVNYALTSCS